MPSLPSIFDQCKPRPEVLAGELPDAIFAADLWEVFCQRAHPDYQDAVRFFAGTHPTENLLDELVLYMARALVLREDHPRSRVNSQWATFFQTLFSIAAQRPQTAVILTLPSEQDANRKLTGELKQFIPTVFETVDELEQTAARQARNLTPTQSYERAAVLGRRLFKKVNASHATQVAEAYAA